MAESRHYEAALRSIFDERRGPARETTRRPYRCTYVHAYRGDELAAKWYEWERRHGDVAAALGALLVAIEEGAA